MQAHRGTALITALLIVAITAAISVMMILNTRVTIIRTNLLFRHDAIEQIVWRQILLAKLTLQKKLTQIAHKQNSKKGIYAFQLPDFKFDEGIVKTVITPIQGRLNINNLVGHDFDTITERLFAHCLPKWSPQKIHQLRLAIQQWLQPAMQNDRHANVAYADSKPPYSVAHQKFISVASLRLIRGIDAKVYQALSPYLCALPSKTKIDINQASAFVLASFNPHISMALARQWVMRRQQLHGFKSFKAFQQLLAGNHFNLPQKALTLSGHYFLVKATFELPAQQVFTVYALLETNLNQPKAMPQLIRVSQETL